MDVRFVALSDGGGPVYLYEENLTTPFRQVLWGDYLAVEKEIADGWLKVIWAPNQPNPPEVYIRKSDTIEKRPLEVIFLDVGQGDGAVVISPETRDDERIMLIDAGEGDNMIRFLNARFKSYRGFSFEAAVMTHPDQDHYGGFLPIFSNNKIGFKWVYHSGLVERAVSGSWAKIGGRSPKDPITGKSYLQNLAIDDVVIQKEFGNISENERRKFPKVMSAAVKNPKIKAFRMLSTEHGDLEDGRTYVPGFSPASKRGYTIEVVGPVVEQRNGKPSLRVLGNYGETKNGHSVLLRLKYGTFSILFGGDLNRKAEEFLLAHYAGLNEFPKEGSQAYKNMIADASATFRADVMKVCHHGSADVTDAFLETVTPAAFVISSGDEEGHVHPRPDLLGKLGRFGRGSSPVLLATELQRSTREREDQRLVEKLALDIDTLATNPTERLKNKIVEEIRELGKVNVEEYGAIYVKTDGERLITAFKIESGSPTDTWFYFEYVFDEKGELVLVN
jgi:beta-lactamase superfamily II metal-dependent hydrolase